MRRAHLESRKPESSGSAVRRGAADRDPGSPPSGGRRSPPRRTHGGSDPSEAIPLPRHDRRDPTTLDATRRGAKQTPRTPIPHWHRQRHVAPTCDNVSAAVPLAHVHDLLSSISRTRSHTRDPQTELPPPGNACALRVYDRPWLSCRPQSRAASDTAHAMPRRPFRAVLASDAPPCFTRPLDFAAGPGDWRRLAHRPRAVAHRFLPLLDARTQARTCYSSLPLPLI